MKKRVLTISGKQGSGKTTSSDMILEELGARVKSFKFAGPLYHIHDVALPVIKQYGIRPMDMTKDGELLQLIGTEYGRRIDENVWVNIAKKEIAKWLEADETNLAIIDDCRFTNEFDLTEDISLMVRLECPEEIRKQRTSYWRENTNHPSEIGLDDYSAQGKFDLYVHTDFTPISLVKEMILNMWLN